MDPRDQQLVADFIHTLRHPPDRALCQRIARSWAFQIVWGDRGLVDVHFDDQVRLCLAGRDTSATAAQRALVEAFRAGAPPGDVPTVTGMLGHVTDIAAREGLPAVICWDITNAVAAAPDWPDWPSISARLVRRPFLGGTLEKLRATAGDVQPHLISAWGLAVLEGRAPDGIPRRGLLVEDPSAEAGFHALVPPERWMSPQAFRQLLEEDAFGRGIHSRRSTRNLTPLKADAAATSLAADSPVSTEELLATWCSEAGLSKREAELLGLIARGYTTAEAATHMGIALGTARAMRQRVLKKLNVLRLRQES